MPAAAFFPFHEYGPAQSAMVTLAVSEVVAQATGAASVGQFVQGAGSTPLLKATRLVGQPMVTAGTGSIPQALPKARARPAVLIRVNELSQDDVTGAVLESPVEDGVTLRQALRVLLAVAAGKTTITPGIAGTATVVFRDVNDTTSRVTAEMGGSERAGVTLNTD